MIIKRILNLIWREFIYGGHLQGLVGAVIFLTIIILINKEVDWKLLIIGYLLTFFNYRYNYYKGIEKDVLTNPERVDYLKKNIKYSQGLLLVCLFFLLWIIIYYIKIKTAIFTIFLLIIGVCYTIWFKDWTKKIIGFKNFYISIPFGLFVIIIGLYYSLLNWSMFFIFFFVFLKMFLNTIFFDTKDIASDKKEGLKTIPVVLDKEKTLKFLHILNFLSFCPLIMGIYLNLLPGFSLIMLIFFFFVFYYLEKAKDENINIQKLSYLVADGEFLLWPIVLLIGKMIL